MRDVLLAKGYDVQYEEFSGWHDYYNWRSELGDALIQMLGVK